MGALAAILIAIGVVAEVLYLGTSGIVPRLGDGLAASLGGLAASPILGGGGAISVALGVLVLGRAPAEGERYASREVLLLLCALAALGFGLAILVGVVRSWSPATLATLSAAGLCQTVLAVGLTIRLATVPERRRRLYLSGLSITFLAGSFHLVLVTLSL